MPLAILHRDGAVSVVTLNRPAQLNTISQPMLSALSQASRAAAPYASRLAAALRWLRGRLRMAAV